MTSTLRLVGTVTLFAAIAIPVAFARGKSKPAPSPPPPPAPTAPTAPTVRPEGKRGPLLTFVDRRGDYDLRHYGGNRFAIASNGKLAASGSLDGSVVIWDPGDGHVVRMIPTPHVNVFALAISPDGRTVATAGWDQTVRLWSIATGAEIWSSSKDATTLAFSPDSKRLIGETQQEYRVWDARDGAVRFAAADHGASRQTHSYALPSLVSSDGRTSYEVVAVPYPQSMPVRPGDGGYHYDLAVFDIDKGTQLRTLPVKLDYPMGLALAPGGDVLAVLGQSLVLVDLATGRSLADLPVRGIEGLLISADKKVVVTWDRQALAGWDVPTRKEIWRAPRGKDFRAPPQLAGATAIVVSQDRSCVALQLADGAELWRQAPCDFFAAAPGTPRVILERGPAAVDILDVTTGKPSAPRLAPTGPLGAITALALSPDKIHVAAVSEDRSVWIYGEGAGRILAPTPEPLYWGRARPRFLANGKLMLVGEVGIDDKQHVYHFDIDANTLEESTEVQRHDIPGTSGNSVVAGDWLLVAEVREHDYVHTFIDLAGREKSRHLPDWTLPAGTHQDLRSDSLYTAVVSADLGRVYLPGPEGTIHAWDLGKGKLVASAPSQLGLISELVLSPDEKRLVSVAKSLDSKTARASVMVWSAADLSLERTLEGPKSYPNCAAISPDGAFVVVGARDGLFVWRLSDGMLLETADFSALREAPSALAFTPDGAILWVGTSLGNVHRFSMTTLRAP